MRVAQAELKRMNLKITFVTVLSFRETLEVPDGGIVCLDWFDNEDSCYADPQTRPTVLILPGLTGDNENTFSIEYSLLIILLFINKLSNITDY